MAPQPPLEDFGVRSDTNVSPRTPKSESSSRQSPVDLGSAVPSLRVDELAIDFGQLVVDGTDVGTTLEFQVAGGSAVTYEGRWYELKQFHFHTPSEHVVDGSLTDAEVHFVNEAADGSVLVVAVFIEGSDAAKGPLGLEEEVTVGALLPGSLTHYAYEGSLTTPPFTEGVQWVVLSKSVTLNTEWIAAFRDRYGANARALQPLNDRLITLG